MMAVFMGAFPVLPGKEEEPRKFADETLARRDELDTSQQRLGITKEQWVLQETPEGSMVIVHFESDDVERAFATFAQSDDSFDVWFKGRVKEITGVDLNESGGPLPQVIFDWSS
jgi:hypothetical protein